MNPDRLRGRTALITGASGGIGEAVARRFAAEGAFVFLADHNPVRGREIAVEIGAAARFVELDVASEPAWNDAMRAIHAHRGRLDVLVHAAAVLFPGMDLESTSIETWRKTYEVNVEGAFLACRHGVATMKAHGGAIVTIASGVAVRPSAKAPAYGSSKAAVLTLTKSVALHCAERGYRIRVNAVLPGAVDTPMLRRNASHSNLSTDAYLAKVAKAHPVGRIGQPEEIASAIAFLASDEASFITGAGIPVDGGQII